LDVVQETLLRALRAEHTFETERSLGPWLRSIAAHVAQRLGGRERLGPIALESPDTIAYEPVDPVHAETVERLLAVLVPEERALVTRHHLEGESLAEIAASLGAPLGTVKARLWRARKRLAKTLEFVLASEFPGAAMDLRPATDGSALLALATDAQHAVIDEEDRNTALVVLTAKLVEAEMK